MSSSNSNKRYSIDSDFGVLSMEESQISQLNKRVRIIICGDSGIGKSALVNALVSNSSKDSTRKQSLEPIEVHGSNICVVDTCGYGALLRAEVIFSHVKNYIEAQFEKTNQLFNSNSQENETLAFIVNQASDALSHLDVCLYLIMGRIKPVDIEYMRSIHDLVNIIPVMIQPDLSLRPEIMTEQRIEILNMMHQHDIKFSYLGYPDFNAIVSACKQPQFNPSCPPFTLDWSSTKKSFHGLIALKQVLFQQQQLQSLRYQTTLKFIQWRKQHQELSASTSSNSTQSSSSSSSCIKNQNLRISQYVSHRRHSMEKELLLQEKKLKQEFHEANLQQRTEIILREIQQLDDHHTLIKAIQQQAQQQAQQQQQQQTTNPMIMLTPYWIPLSIIVSILVVYYQKGYLI